VVLVGVDYILVAAADQYEATTSVIQHFFQKDVKMIFITFTPDGEVFYPRHIAEVNTMGKEYGEDYVWLGYLAGVETAMAAVATDIRSVFPTDAYGTSLESLAVMQGINSGADIDFFLHSVESYDKVEAGLRQFRGKYGVVHGIITMTSTSPLIEPYYPSQVVGLLAGVQGAAEYQTLTGVAGQALVSMDQLSLGFLWALCMVIFGNILYFSGKAKGGMN
jgi:subtilisin family serine protease